MIHSINRVIYFMNSVVICNVGGANSKISKIKSKDKKMTDSKLILEMRDYAVFLCFYITISKYGVQRCIRAAIKYKKDTNLSI